MPTKTILPGLMLLALTVTTPRVHAEENRPSAGEIDTEHLFGFNAGTDIGEVGDREIEGELNGRFRKRTGSYTALSPMLGLEFVPIHNLRIELAMSVVSHRIVGVSGLDDLQQAAFQGLSLEMRYRLLDRAQSLFGLAIDVEPHWGRVDETSGAPLEQYGLDLAILVDKELIPNQLVGVLNLLYQPEFARSRVTGEWMRESTLGASTGLMLHVNSGIFIGAEARYLRRYESASPENFAGHALFLGPVTFVKFSDHWWMSAALDMQVAGRAVGNSAALDLANFERYQVKFRIGYNF